MQMAADGTFSRRLESGRGFSEVIIRSGRCFVCGEMLWVGMVGVWLVALLVCGVSCGLRGLDLGCGCGSILAAKRGENTRYRKTPYASAHSVGNSGFER